LERSPFLRIDIIEVEFLSSGNDPSHILLKIISRYFICIIESFFLPILCFTEKKKKKKKKKKKEKKKKSALLNSIGILSGPGTLLLFIDSTVFLNIKIRNRLGQTYKKTWYTLVS